MVSKDVGREGRNRNRNRNREEGPGQGQGQGRKEGNGRYRSWSLMNARLPRMVVGVDPLTNPTYNLTWLS
jgi:hypothetical protein